MHTPRLFRAPELIFDNLPSPASDIWALASVILILFVGRWGHPFFESCDSDKDILYSIVSSLGKLPKPWWSRFAERAEWFDDRKDGQAKSKFLEFPEDHPMDERERDPLEVMMRRMLDYDPAQRPNADEVVKMTYSAGWGQPTSPQSCPRGK